MVGAPVVFSGPIQGEKKRKGKVCMCFSAFQFVCMCFCASLCFRVSQCVCVCVCWRGEIKWTIRALSVQTGRRQMASSNKYSTLTGFPCSCCCPTASTTPTHTHEDTHTRTHSRLDGWTHGQTNGPADRWRRGVQHTGSGWAEPS